MSEPGLNIIVPSVSLREIASWVIASELVRRAPKRLRLIQTHPGGGQYDCLTVMEGPDSVCDFNRQGSLHFANNSSDAAPIDIWLRMICQPSPKQVLDEISVRLRIPIPEKLPAGNAASLTYRVIARVLKLSVFGAEQWRCLNGFHDSSRRLHGTTRTSALPRRHSSFTRSTNR